MLVLPVVLLLLVFRCSSHPHPKSVLVISMFLVYAACSMSVKLLWQPVDSLFGYNYRVMCYLDK